MHPTAPCASGTTSDNSAQQPILWALAGLAICGPAWLAYSLSPSVTFFNQAVALTGWAGLFAWRLWRGYPVLVPPWRLVTPAFLALALLSVATIGSLVIERLPTALGLSALGLLAASALTFFLGVVGGRYEIGRQLFKGLCLATVLAGFVSVGLALVQVSAPDWADGDWIARASTPGRAGGNLRQPNHLSSLLLWSIAALVWLHDALVVRQAFDERSTSTVRAHLGERVVTIIVMVGLILGVVLTVSRTGAVCVLLLAFWGIADKRLSHFSRVLLWLTPLVYALCWLGMTAWAQASEFAGAVQLHKADPSSSRFGIWANTLSLIAQHPWFGVGWGEFNFAWSLTPFPDRPVAFFDHTHNLPLNLLVELGIPLGTLVLALLSWSLWRAFVACRVTPYPASSMVRTAFVMVLMMAVHSMLEYPLWYAYFLLPTAFMLGICLGHSVPPGNDAKARPAPRWLRPALMVASLALILGTVFSVFDYLRVTKIFSVDDDDTTPLSQRIAEGQKSVFFAHHADYAAATVATHPSTAWKAFRRAPHLLLDTRLMMAWAKGYAEKGDIERARYIADRLREFRNPDAADFFAECDKAKAAGTAEPFQCKPATRQFTYEDFKLR